MQKRLPHLTLPSIQIDYPSRWILFFVAVFVGAFMVLYAGPKLFGEAFWDPEFYKAFIPSAVAAYMVLTQVSRSFTLLDASHSWYGDWPVRLLLQLYHGICLPSLALMGFFAIYFIVRGQPASVAGYYRLDFFFAVAMVVGMNALYFRYFVQRTAGYRRAMRAWLEYVARMARPGVDFLGAGPAIRLLPPGQTLGTAEAETDRPGNDLLSLIDREAFTEQQAGRVAYYETKGLKNAVWAHGLDGTEDFLNLAIEQLDELIGGTEFFLYNKGKMINRAAIKDAYKKGRFWYIILKDPYGGRELQVARRRAVEFAEWWQGSPG